MRQITFLKKSMVFALLIAVLSFGLASSAIGANTGEFTLTSLWVKVADTSGAVDCDCGTASVESAVFSPDGTKIATGTKLGTNVSLWETSSGNRLWKKDVPLEVESMGITPDGNFVVSGDENAKIEIRRVSDGVLVQTLNMSASVEGMYFSPNGNFLATGDESGTVSIFRVSDWQLLDTASHSDVINSVHWTPDSQRIVTGSKDKTAKIWSVSSTGSISLIRTLTGHNNSIKTVRFSPDGYLVASGSKAGDHSLEKSVKIWRVSDGQLLKTIPFETTGVEAVEFTPDGKYVLATGQKNGETVRYIRVIRVADYKEIYLHQVFRAEYFDFNDSGTKLVSSHEDGTVRLWQVNRRAPTYLMDFGFNGAPTGAAPSGWTINAPVGTSVTVVEVPSATNKSMRLHDTTTSASASAAKTFTAQSDLTTVEWDFKETTAGQWPKFNIMSGTTPATELFVNSSKQLVYRDASGTDRVIRSIADNTWYTVRLEASPITEKYDIFVNGQLYVKDAAFRNAVSNLDNIKFTSGGSFTGSLFIDDVKISTP